MKRRITAGLLFLIPVLILTVVNLNGPQDRPVDGGKFEYEWKASEEITPVTVSVVPDQIVLPTISELLEELETGIKKAEDEALRILAGEENALGYYSNLILAKRYENEGKDASGYFRAALELYYTDEIHFKLADQLLKNGKVEEAKEEYLKLLPDEKALQVLTALKTDIEKICDAYAGKKEWKALEEFLTPIFENGNENDNVTLISYYAQAFFEQGEYNKAFPYYKKLYEMDNSDLNIAWRYARCLEASGQTSAALKIYSSIGEKGAYRRGLILQNQGKTLEAAEAFAESNEAAALWQAARIWDSRGMLDKAIETYTRIASIAGLYQDDAAYRAYILSRRIGRNDLSKLTDVLTFHPAWMVRLGDEPVFPEVPDIAYQKPDYLKQAAIYEADGFLDAADIEVAIGSKSTSLEEKLALGDWYLERGQYYNAILWGIRSLSEQPTKRGYQLAYPRLYQKYVLEASEKYGLEPALIWAIIREESHFRHDAVSGAGAVGLMQIMPATGKDIASRMGISITDEDLLNPEINIKLGSYYISSMLSMFSNDIDRALAAYNGGPGNVKKWLQSSFMTSSEDFPTAISFTETQEYITKVRNSYYIYKWLYE